jgi:hypothetical protein
MCAIECGIWLLLDIYIYIYIPSGLERGKEESTAPINLIYPTVLNNTGYSLNLLN